MLGTVQAAYGPLERCADPAGEVAKNFRVPGYRGTVSFITSMTKAFCSGTPCAVPMAACCCGPGPAGPATLHSLLQLADLCRRFATHVLLPPADCNRLRVMADGNLKVCLFGANEVSLRCAAPPLALDSTRVSAVLPETASTCQPRWLPRRSQP